MALRSPGTRSIAEMVFASIKSFHLNHISITLLSRKNNWLMNTCVDHSSPFRCDIDFNPVMRKGLTWVIHEVEQIKYRIKNIPGCTFLQLSRILHDATTSKKRFWLSVSWRRHPVNDSTSPIWMSQFSSMTRSFVQENSPAWIMIWRNATENFRQMGTCRYKLGTTGVCHFNVTED